MSCAAWTPFLLVLPLLVTDEVELSDPGAVQESTSCARCHSNAPRASGMLDAAGREVAPYDLWRGTMMANAARDPLWRAVVSAEIAATPSRQTEIEATCLSCHTPMAHRVGLDDHGTGSLMHQLECEGERSDLARDGVSCTICHGMSAQGLGTEASFSAGFRLDAQRRLFGPHESPFTMPMRHMTGFTPTYGAHITESALCGSCHTLETEALDPAGQPVGARLLEQAPYLEWRNSDFSTEVDEPGPLAASCQACHMPTSDEDGRAIRTRIVRNPAGRDFPPTRPREPFGRHVLVGGNTLVLAMLRDQPEQLGVVAPAAAFDAAIEATRDQLQRRTATVEIEDVLRAEGELSFAVQIANLTGHKFPTAHPTRRAWLRVVVRDASGTLLFASGEADTRGRILGADEQPLSSELVGGPIEPHREVVRSGDEVATYQAVMADAQGAPTHTLLRGAEWLVDTRLLPRGWSAEYPGAERTAPVGTAQDEDFAAGGDRVRFELELGAEGPLTVEASLLYQPLGARWAAELLRWDTPEVEAFRELYDAADLRPEIVAADHWEQ